VTATDHERQAVEDLAVDLGLEGQPCERVAVALEFKPRELSVNDSDVDAHRA